eukprot:2866626-Rhodomonas_salina.1
MPQPTSAPRTSHLLRMCSDLTNVHQQSVQSDSSALLHALPLAPALPPVGPRMAQKCVPDCLNLYRKRATLDQKR